MSDQVDGRMPVGAFAASAGIFLIKHIDQRGLFHTNCFHGIFPLLINYTNNYAIVTQAHHDK